MGLIAVLITCSCQQILLKVCNMGSDIIKPVLRRSCDREQDLQGTCNVPASLCINMKLPLEVLEDGVKLCHVTNTEYLDALQ